MEEKYKLFQEYEENACMIGWDFSFMKDKLIEEPIPWNYKAVIKKYLSPTQKLLDIETGGGEFLLSLKHPHQNTYALEGFESNYLLCKERLSPLGIKVVKGLGDTILPFDDDSFDIVINRHGAYRIDEIKRVLKNNGIFITQQVGSYNNKPLSDILTPWRKEDFDSFTLEQEVLKFHKDGFDVLEKQEKKLYARYTSIEGVIFMAKIIEWEFPQFTVEKCFRELLRIDELIEKNGYFESIEHRFLIVVKNNK